MKVSNWEAVLNGSQTRVVEVTAAEAGAAISYEQAKEAAATYLRLQMAPLANRLGEIEGDKDRERGRRPNLKVWSHANLLVAAATKRQAMELALETRHYFNNYYRLEEDGDWWYDYAHEPSLWVRFEDDSGGRMYRRAIGVREAGDRMADYIASKFPDADAAAVLIRGDQVHHLEGADGTSYPFTVSCSECDTELIVHARMSREYTGVQTASAIRFLKPSTAGWLLDGF